MNAGPRHRVKTMKLALPKFPALIFESMATSALLGYLKVQAYLSDELFFLFLSLFCLIFSLYYGLSGAWASILFAIFLNAMFLQNDFVDLFSRFYLELSFLMAAVTITAFNRSGMEKKTIRTELLNQVLNQRVERLNIELSEKNRALQDVFREALIDMESPRIMYQTIRCLEYIQDRKSLFNEILNILYVYCHVEKSCVYEFVSKNQFKKVATFGTSNLPENIRWNEQRLPEILRVAQRQKEIIVPMKFSNRFIMAVPILSTSGKLLYIILIEEVRFISMSDALLNLLKVAAFWMKSIIENQFHREEFLLLSAFQTVVVYRKEISKKIFRSSIMSHERYRLPYACIWIRGEITEAACREANSLVRIHDEFFLLSDTELILLLTMITESNVPFVLKRIQEALPHLEIGRETNVDSVYR
ncbi:MAG: hypothetical protein C4530_15380 [Desulfobacteraceae bacterium]|nr:MAG: hypothetical protein C4530_15380 [Desulfobacteraceae bacterium]